MSNILTFEEYKEKYENQLAGLYYRYEGDMSKAQFIKNAYDMFVRNQLAREAHAGQTIKECFGVDIVGVKSISPMKYVTPKYVTVITTFDITDGSGKTKTVSGELKLDAKILRGN